MDEIINEILDGIDDEQFREEDIAEEIKNFAKNRYKQNPPDEIIWEQIAFSFTEKYYHDNNPWGTYFGPMFVIRGKEYPSIKAITPDTISYWGKRAKEEENPILKARYSNLVWDFSEKITGEHPDYSIGQIFIDSVIDIVDKDLHKDKINVIDKLERALNIALNINDKKRVKHIQNAIITYEEKIAVDAKPGFWGFSYELLVRNKSVELSEEIRDSIVKNLEERFDRLLETDNFSGIQKAFDLLVEYCNQNDHKSKLKDLTTLYTEYVYDKIGKDSANRGLLFLEEIHHLCLDYGLSENRNDIEVKIKKLGKKATGELKKIETKFEIPDSEITDFINGVISEDLEQSIERLVHSFIPKKRNIEYQIKDLYKQSPFSFSLTRTIQDIGGRTIAKLGTLDEDPEGHIINRISKNMAFEYLFLQKTIDELLSKFELNEEEIVNILYQSPAFKEQQKEFISIGIEAYLNEDYISALHLLIPQIEESIRKIVEINGGSVLYSTKGGSFNYRTLDTLLKSDQFKKIFGEDGSLYLRVLYTHPLGWNLRNKVCHGICNPEIFDRVRADRVFHSMLYIWLKTSNNSK